MSASCFASVLPASNRSRAEIEATFTVVCPSSASSARRQCSSKSKSGPAVMMSPYRGLELELDLHLAGVDELLLGELGPHVDRDQRSRHVPGDLDRLFNEKVEIVDLPLRCVMVHCEPAHQQEAHAMPREALQERGVPAVQLVQHRAPIG